MEFVEKKQKFDIPGAGRNEGREVGMHELNHRGLSC